MSAQDQPARQRFFSFPVGRGRLLSCIIEKEPTTTRGSLVCYRLCVYASGSLITDRLNCFTLIKFSCLHFGQNNGKLISSVSDLILIRVFLDMPLAVELIGLTGENYGVTIGFPSLSSNGVKPAAFPFL